MLTKLDDLIYHAASKPLIDLLQKWFHWNRYQLIAGCLKKLMMFCAGIVVVGVFVTASQWWARREMMILETAILLIIIVLVLVSAKKWRPLITDLQECSTAFEEGRRPTMSMATVDHQAFLRSYRATHVFECCSELGLVVTYVLRDDMYDIASLWALTFLVTATTVFEGHLWRSSDLDPRDRRSIMEPERETSSAS